MSKYLTPELEIKKLETENIASIEDWQGGSFQIKSYLGMNFHNQQGRRKKTWQIMLSLKLLPNNE